MTKSSPRRAIFRVNCDHFDVLLDGCVEVSVGSEELSQLVDSVYFSQQVVAIASCVHLNATSLVVHVLRLVQQLMDAVAILIFLLIRLFRLIRLQGILLLVGDACGPRHFRANLFVSIVVEVVGQTKLLEENPVGVLLTELFLFLELSLAKIRVRCSLALLVKVFVVLSVLAGVVEK